jgi:hypothetical protein
VVDWASLLRILPKLGDPYADTFTILVSGDEDPERVKSILGNAAEQCETLLPRPAPVIEMADASSSLTDIRSGCTTTHIQDVRIERKRSASRL